MKNKCFLIIIFFEIMSSFNICASTDIDGGLIFIKGGVFLNKNSLYYNSRTIVSDFWIGRYEITQREWINVMQNNPSNFKDDNLPVDNISWYDAIDYCNARSLQEGLTPVYLIEKPQILNNAIVNNNSEWSVTANWNANGYRLPTEAEWEYAASGGMLTNNQIFHGCGRRMDTSFYEENKTSSTYEVGSRRPNELGLYEMNSNVWEWCWDIYNDEVIFGVDPRGVSIGNNHVMRGGSLFFIDYSFRFPGRDGGHSYFKTISRGLRVVRSRLN